MKKVLAAAVSLALVLMLFGCAGINLERIWSPVDKKEDVVPEALEVDSDFNVFSAIALEEQQILFPHSAQEYADIAERIQRSTLDNLISGILMGEEIELVDNPYLVGDTEDDGSARKKVGLLEDMIIDVNPVEWKINDLTSVNDTSALIEVKYVLPDGRDITGDKFTAKLVGEEWYIDFDSFYDSFARVTQFSLAGRNHVVIKNR